MPPTLAQLRAEPWWDREISPPTLVALGNSLRAHFGVSPVAVGIKGDIGHLFGGHRSPEWIRRSRYSSSGSGDGSLIQSNGGTASSSNRDLRALDMTPGAWGTPDNRRKMISMTTSLDGAVKSGRCPQVRRFWGTRDGRTVYGWDAFYRRNSSSDSSHLDHLHVEMYPDRVNWDHSAVFAAITGGDADMDATQAQQLNNIHDWLFDYCRGLVAADPGTPHITTYVPNQILTTLRDRPPVPLNDAQLNALANQIAGQLAPQLEAAAERAVRKVLGSLDGATPPNA